MNVRAGKKDVLRVAVLGGGIIGISSAIRILEELGSKYNIEITVLATQFTPHTTSDGAAGFWNPYIFGNIAEKRLRFWCIETFEYLLSLWKTPDAFKYGIGLLSSYYLSDKPIDAPSYKDIFLEWHEMTQRELHVFPKKFRFGISFTTLYAECSKLLPYMMERITAGGGKLICRTVNHLSELINEFDVVINCPGVEAARLVQDPAVQPIRGQTIRVKAPWIKHAVSTDDFYILPNTDEVVCGGTHQEGDWNTNVDLKDRAFIWEGCCELIPSLKNATIIREWVGLRPGRTGPRLERETLRNEDGKKQIQIIHNYGHGGSGVTLFWGCAKEVVEQLEEILNATHPGKVGQHLRSHL